MSSLCCCWRSKLPEGEAAAAAAVEMQEAPEVARAAEEVEKEEAAAADGGEALLLNPAPGDEADSSSEEAEDLENNNMFGPSKKKKAELFYYDLLFRINALRMKSGLRRLRRDEDLCQHAEEVWNKRSVVPYGFAAVPNCFVSKFIPDAAVNGRPNTKGLTGTGRPLDCLTYWDLPCHRHAYVPYAAFHYWSTGGTYHTEDTKLPWNPDFAKFYPKPKSQARADLETCRHKFRSILLDPGNRRVGLFYGKCFQELRNKARPYGVIILFD